MISKILLYLHRIHPFSAPVQDQLLDTAAQLILQPLAGLFHPFFRPGGRGGCSAPCQTAREHKRTCWASPAVLASHRTASSPLGREREKSRWKLHVSCQLDLTADQEHGERKLSLLLQLPQKGCGSCTVQERARSQSVP